MKHIMNTVTKPINKSAKIAKILRQRILAGRFLNGTLPNSRNIAKEFQVKNETALQAILLLQKEGLVSGSSNALIRKRSKVKATLAETAVLCMYMRGDFYSDIFEAVCGKLLQSGITGIPFNIKEEHDAGITPLRMQKLAELLEAAPLGIVCEGDSYWKLPFLSDFPNTKSIILNYFDSPGKIPHSAVFFDYEKAGQLLTKHLIERGSRNIMFYMEEPDIFPIKDPEQQKNHLLNQLLVGYRDMLNMNGLKENILSLENSELAFKKDILRGELAGATRPDAIICASDVKASWIENVIHGLGLSIPDDIAVTGLFNTPWCTAANTALTSVEFPAAIIADKVVSILKSDDMDPVIEKICPVLHIRESSAF
jgi:DNA-binding LacI/PurR family transcriptional regulator